MRKFFILVLGFCACLRAEIPLIGMDAPPFEAKTLSGKIKFPNDFKGKWIIFFSYPSICTPICSLELEDFLEKQKEFASLNCVLIGISTNPEKSQNEWQTSLIEKLKKEGKIVSPIPLISDESKKIVTLYGMIHPANEEKTVRSVFFIGPEGKIRAFFFYPLRNGRNFQEIKRLLLVMQETELKNEPSKPIAKAK